MEFNNNDYFKMDTFASQDVIEPILPDDEQAVADAINLGTAEIGTTTHPMQNTLQSLKARVMEGVGRVELSFIGSGKGNSQAPTPESFDQWERQDMKELLTINDIKASVHAAVHTQSLAGFGERGFSDAARNQALKEIKRAIDFAGDVTNGGAVVFHMSEWQRPIFESGKDPLKKEGFKKEKIMFEGYDTEQKDAVLYVVDERTGRVIDGLTRDTKVYEPVYKTIKDERPDLIGKEVTITEYDENNNPVVRKHVVQPDDWVSVDGRPIPRDTESVPLLFERVPVFESDKTSFKIREKTWDDFVKEAEEWNKTHKKKLTPEEIYARTVLSNKVLQAKGSSLFHAMSYENDKRHLDEINKALEFWRKVEEASTPEERERLKRAASQQMRGQFTVPEEESPVEYLERQKKLIEDRLRHTHAASASSDAQAVETIKLIEHLKPAEEYGLKKTADTIAKAALIAMETTKRKKLENPLYIAPENYSQHFYGSHPDEMRRIIEESRKVMADRLLKEGRVKSRDEALNIAKQHIKATLDIGHMNMWRQYFDPKDENGNSIYKTYEERQKAFDKWLLSETEKLVKDGIVGHVHLADNFGYDDEHLTPGRGNVPMKEFLKKMEELGMKDMIVEPGSFNALTTLPDTLSFLGSPIYSLHRGPRFNQIQRQHFGYNAPPFFIAGSYSPSNDWRPWSDVPLE